MALEKVRTEEPVKVDIIAGFLGAGKTTLINKLLGGAVDPSETVLIENEFGDVSIDDELLAGNGMEVKTLASGCICCTLRAGFLGAFPELVEAFHPKRIVIEPTGMASPTELLTICEQARKLADVRVNSLISLMSAKKIERLVKMDIPAFNMQFESVSFIVLTHLEGLSSEEIENAIDLLRGKVGDEVPILARPIEDIDALELLSLAEEAFAQSGLGAGDEGSAGASGNDGHDGHDHEGHEGHDHDHDGHEGHDHDHHHHHDSVGGVESKAFAPAAPFAESELDALMQLFDGEGAGTVLRAKGFLEQEGAGMVLFEQVYGSGSVKPCSYAGAPKFVVIGKDLDEQKLRNALKA